MLFFSTAASASEAATVYVEAGALTASIAAGLTAEIAGTAIAPRPEEADILVGVRRADARLDVQVVAASGATILERRVAIEQEIAPALRVVVLLVAEALATPPPEPIAAAPPEPITAPPEPIAIAPPLIEDRALPLRLSAGLAGTAWIDPITPQFGPYFAGTIAIDELQVGLQLIFTPCCGVSKTGVINGSAYSLALLATADLPLFKSGGFEIAPLIALGAGLRIFDGQWLPLGASASISPQYYAQPELVTRAGALLRRALSDRISLRVGVGVEARAFVQELVVPIGRDYPDEGETLSPGIFSPWLDLGVTLALF